MLLRSVGFAVEIFLRQQAASGTDHLAESLSSAVQLCCLEHKARIAEGFVLFCLLCLSFCVGFSVDFCSHLILLYQHYPSGHLLCSCALQDVRFYSICICICINAHSYRPMVFWDR